MRRWSLSALIITLALATQARAQDLIPLRYGETASTWKSIFSLPVRVAQTQGFFARHGLGFEMVQIDAGGEASLAALEEGKADFAHVATSFLITGAMRGRTTVAIAAEFNNPIYSLVAKPWFKRIEDLKGRRIGMADMSGAVSLATLALFKQHGVREDDLEIKVVEGTSPRFQCVTQGDCDAVPLGQPQDFYAKRQGFNILGATNEAVPDFLYTVTAVQKDWAASHADVVRRYVRAMRDAFLFVRAPENRARMVALIREFWTASDESAAGTMDLFFQPEKNVLPIQGEISRAGMEQVLRFLREGGILTGKPPSFEHVADTRYLEAEGIR